MDQPMTEASQAPVEPYGATLLRQFHEDCLCLLMEYDAGLAPLDNPDVRAYLTECLKLLERQFVSGAEKLYKKAYKQLPPLGEQAVPPGEAVVPEEGMPLEEGEAVVEMEEGELPPNPPEVGLEEPLPEEASEEDPFAKGLRGSKAMPDGMGEEQATDEVPAAVRPPVPGDAAVEGMGWPGKSHQHPENPGRRAPKTMAEIEQELQQLAEQGITIHDAGSLFGDEPMAEQKGAKAKRPARHFETEVSANENNGKRRADGPRYAVNVYDQEGQSANRGPYESFLRDPVVEYHATQEQADADAEIRARQQARNSRIEDVSVDGSVRKLRGRPYSDAFREVRAPSDPSISEVPLDEPDAKALSVSITPIRNAKDLKSVCGYRVAETRGAKSRHADLTAKGLNAYLRRYQGPGAKSLLANLAKKLNAGRPAKFSLRAKALCPGCQHEPCTCAQVKAAQADVLAPGEEVDAARLHAKAVNEFFGMKSAAMADPLADRPADVPRWPERPAWLELFGEDGGEDLKLAIEELNAAGEASDWTDEARNKSFHHAKQLSRLAERLQRAVKGGPGANLEAMDQDSDYRRRAREAGHTDEEIAASPRMRLERGRDAYQTLVGGGLPASPAAGDYARQEANDILDWGDAQGRDDVGEAVPQAAEPAPGPRLRLYSPDEHAKAMAACAEFFKMLSREKAYGEPHRREAKYHAERLKALAGLAAAPTLGADVKEMVGEMGEKAVDKRVLDTYERESLDLGTMPIPPEGEMNTIQESMGPLNMSYQDINDTRDAAYARRVHRDNGTGPYSPEALAEHQARRQAELDSARRIISESSSTLPKSLSEALRAAMEQAKSIDALLKAVKPEGVTAGKEEVRRSYRAGEDFGLKGPAEEAYNEAYRSSGGSDRDASDTANAIAHRAPDYFMAAFRDEQDNP